MLSLFRKLIEEKKEEHRLLQLLKKLNTEKVIHKEGNFFEHLFGTYRLLKKWGYEKPVCYAGLFHSIYGTQVFKRMTISYEKRELMQKTIGNEAEKLVYLFSVIDRPQAFTNFTEPPIFKNMVTNELIQVSEYDMKNLIAIEIANLIDQKADKKLISQIKKPPSLTKETIVATNSYVG